nr:restriction endonuclease [Sphingomonas japonica]
MPTLEVLDERGGSASIEEIEAALIERFGFSQEQLDATYAVSGDTIVTDKMSWARSHLKFPGYVTNETKGVWVLTEKGRDALAAGTTREHLRREVLAAKSARRAEQVAAQAAVDVSTLEVTEEQEAAEQDWTDTLLARLKTMPPDGFERLAQRLLRESGFVRVEVTGKSGDGGIDGSGVLRMNLISFQVLFQCKRYAGSVPTGTVRDFRGAMQGRADKGLIITTGTFTADARREATRDGAPAIDLIDGEALCQLLKERRLGVQVREVVREEIAILPDFFDEI